MKENMTLIIEKVKKNEIISKDSIVINELICINYFCDNDEQKAFLLGNLFITKFDIEELTYEERSFVRTSISSLKMNRYFHLKDKPKFKNDGFLVYFSYLFFFVGISSFLYGLSSIIFSKYSIGFGPKYLVFIVREGGYYFILGLILIVGCLLRLNFEYKKKYFFKRCIEINSKVD